MFSIRATRYWWIRDDGRDDPDDRCLHGHVVVRIGKTVLEDDCTVSSTGLFLLRTLTEDHVPLDGYSEDGNQMLPCCGFFMVADDDLQSVTLDGCPNGTDWNVRHAGDGVLLETDGEEAEQVSLADYRREVYRFCDGVEAYYRACQSKRFQDGDGMDDFNRRGYTAFWNEWRRRRYAE